MNCKLIKVLSVVFSASILLSACSGAASKQEGLIVMDENNTKVYPQMDMLIDMVDEWEVIPLENSEQALLHSSSNIEVDDSLFFIFSTPSAVSAGTRQEIKVFDYSGKFLYNIGTFGRGPLEYSIISNWTLNRKDKQVWIYSQPWIIKYGYDGKFVDRVEIDSQWGFISLFRVLPDENIMKFNMLQEGTNVSHVLLDTDLNPVDTLETFVISSTSSEYSGGAISYWGNNIVSIHNSSVLVSQFLCDTLFRYSKKHLQPAYYIPIAPSFPKGFSLRNEYDFDNLPNDLRAQGFDFNKNSMIMSVFETDTYCIFINNKQSVWHKELKRGAVFGHEGNIKQIPFRLVCADRSSLIGSIDAIRLVQYKEKCESEGVALPAQLKELFDNGFNEENNTVLFRYKLKTKSELF